jgi:hypothetical protein
MPGSEDHWQNELQPLRFAYKDIVNQCPDSREANGGVHCPDRQCRAGYAPRRIDEREVVSVWSAVLGLTG